VKVRRALEVSDKTTKELAVATGYDYDYLRNRVLPPMRKHKAIYKVGTKGRHGEALWGLHPPGDAATPATSHREVADVAAPNQVIETPEGVRDLANEISSATVVGLDLETMPQPGWKEEVLEEYRSQLSKLKKRPKADKRKCRLSKIKDRVYKDYATNSDVAIPRVISLATPGEEGINAGGGGGSREPHSYRCGDQGQLGLNTPLPRPDCPFQERSRSPHGGVEPLLAGAALVSEPA
jgi:hypothetical protein